MSWNRITHKKSIVLVLLGQHYLYWHNLFIPNLFAPMNVCYNMQFINSLCHLGDFSIYITINMDLF